MSFTNQVTLWRAFLPLLTMKLYFLIPLLLCSWVFAQDTPETILGNILPAAESVPLEKAPQESPGSPRLNPATNANLNSKWYPTAGIPPWFLPQPAVKPTLFYVVRLEVTTAFSKAGVAETAVIDFEVMQGDAEKLTVEVLGEAPILSVTGEGLKSWALRKEGNTRFLDLVPTDAKGRALKVSAIFKKAPIELPLVHKLATFGPAGSTGFSAVYTVSSKAGLRHRLVEAEGVLSLKSGEGIDRLSAAGRARVSAGVALSAAEPSPVELRETRLVGEVFSKEGTASFRLIGTAHVTSTEPISLTVLRGRAAPVEAVTTPDYRLMLSREGYQIEFQNPGVYPIDLAFVTPVQTAGEWKKIDFFVPGGSVVPIELKGITPTAVFDGGLPVGPILKKGAHQAFLPASGTCRFAWQPERKTSDGKLFFTSEAMGEISVGAGLLRQMTSLTIKTLQGSLPALDIQLAGAGEVLAVEGENVLSWQVTDKRVLEVLLSRPVNKEASFVIRSQSAVDALPIKIEPLRFTPVGAVRHSGYFRVYNRGAVRIEVMKLNGLTQLSPDQYPEALELPKSIRQVFHYRYPAANRSFSVSAERVKPEINVSQALAYELTEPDRVLRADLELEIREAGIREWEFFGPADYSVVSLTGADVADYVLSEPENGQRRLKVIFSKEVLGRRLVKVHFEKNEAAQAGVWNLPGLSYPGSTVVSGELGVSAAPGYRVNPGEVEGLAEMPLARLMKRGPTLQQAFRIRAGEWSAQMTVTALSQNVQADTYHFYSLREKKAYVSVLLNYFVTGAPVGEWKLTLPAGIEHLDVDGRDIRDYRKLETEGASVLVVPLHRPVMGAYQLLVTYEQDAELSLALGGLTAEEVQAERGFIQVVSPGQVELSEIGGDEKLPQANLQQLDPLELPAEYQLMSYAPTLKAWQYQRRPFSLKGKVSWFDRGETALQVVEYAEVSSRINRDGEVVTVSSFDVRTRDSQELKLKIPEGLKVRDVAVNGKQVTIREADDLILVPLPDSVSPTLPVKVTVNSSQAGGGTGEDIRLMTPELDNTTQLMTRWKVTPDNGYQLNPGTVSGLSLLTAYSLENGFSWIENKALFSFVILVVAWTFGGFLMRIRAGVSILGAGMVLFASAGAFYLASQSIDQRVELPEILEYRASVKSPEATLGVTVSHVEAGAVRASDFGLFVLVTSLMVAISTFFWPARRGVMLLLAAFGFSYGALSQAGGASWFFGVLGVVILVLWWLGIRGLLTLWKDLFAREEWEEEEEGEEEKIEADSESKRGLTTLLLVGLLTSFGVSSLDAKEDWATAIQAGDSLSEVWEIKDRRLMAEASYQLTGKAGERFMLVQSPATLTKFEGENLKVVTENGNYLVIPTVDGTFQAKFSYQAPASEVTQGVPILGGMAAVRSLTVHYEAAGWSIESRSAVRQKVLDGQGSSAQLWLAPEGDAKVVLSPRARDVAAEAMRFYAEVDDLYIPGPGVVDGRHRVKIRPAQGQVKQLVLRVPEGFTVSDVSSKLVGPWRFDPVKRILTIELAPFQSKPFYLDVETQRALAELPAEVVVAPMRVQGAAGEVGMLAVAFGGEAQLDRDEAKGMSPVNLADFSNGLIPRDREKRPIASLQKVYRYSKGEASLTLKVAPVSPEVRVDSQQRLSFGEERTVLAVDLTASITRAGVFRLSFPLPEGFEVESLTGPALNHWVEIEDEEVRTVTMTLNGKTMGTQKFSLVLAGATPDLPAQNWTVPNVSLQEANRQSGQLVIVPGRGIQLSVEKRKDLSALDPRAVGGSQAGSFAFRLLQKSWELALAVEQLAPSVAAQVLHDLELREGRSKSRVDVRLQVDHASIKELEVELPALLGVDALTVRVSGGEVRDIVNLAGNRWQVRFKRRVIGEVPFRIEYEEIKPTEQTEPESTVYAVKVVEARQQETYLALRPGARLRLEPVRATDWDLVDWAVLPKSLFQLDRSGAPAAFLRSTQMGGGVLVGLSRHSVVAGAKMRVVSGALLTVLSQEGEIMNQAELRLETLQRGSLILTLPPESRLFGAFVNEERALVVQDGDSYRFHVTGDAAGDDRNMAKVRFTYATTLGEWSPKNLPLKAFKIGEPLENVSWTISLPEGYSLADSKGDLDLKERTGFGEVSREQYHALVRERNAEQEQIAMMRIDRASLFFKAGDQIQGNLALGQVYDQENLSPASNEDVRVKMESVARKNAIVGLNTRRQRLYNDNGLDVVDVSQGRNDQIEAAIRANPVFTGSLNVGADDYRSIISGNNAEVNRMLETIASKWVRNQRVTEPTGQMIDPVIPAHGASVVFTRMIQVDGEVALELQLELQPEQASASWGGKLIILALIILSVLVGWNQWKSKEA